jgi:hypothetical protein
MWRRMLDENEEKEGDEDEDEDGEKVEEEGEEEEGESDVVRELLSKHSVWLEMVRRRPRLSTSRNPTSPIYLLRECSCKLIIYCERYVPELNNYLLNSFTTYGTHIHHTRKHLV